MAFGVFIHRADSIYDDRPSERYQFPAMYLDRAQQCLGDWILYYEPIKVKETRGYFAVAKVERIVADPTAPGMFLALIEPGSFLEFPAPVPFADGIGPVERALAKDGGGRSGRAQWAVRPISARDFGHIVSLGLDEGSDPVLPREDEDEALVGVRDSRLEYHPPPLAQRAQQLVSRTVRDRSFRKLVLRAYGERCAITGLRLINGGGRAEAQAAHIQPVEARGPDAIGNGIALSGTAHWMFDRGLISLSDALEVLVSRQANDPDGVRAMINASGRAIMPLRARDRPHPSFLAWHRTHRFKQ